MLQGYLLDDSTRTGVEGGSVTLLADGASLDTVITDEDGWFSFELPSPGSYQLEGNRLGYARTRSEAIDVQSSDTLTVEFFLRMEPVALEPIQVMAGRGRGASEFFERMKGWGKGVFMTPAMIDSISPSHPADVLRGQEETWLSWRQGRLHLEPRIRTYLGSGCVGYVLDGRRINTDLWGPAWVDSPLAWISGADVVAVEYYRYVGEVPPELRRFATMDGSDQCGLLVFWTSVGW